jgi:hypothetical protein
LNDLRILVSPIGLACEKENQFLTEEQDQMILEAIPGLIARAEQLEAGVLGG